MIDLRDFFNGGLGDIISFKATNFTNLNAIAVNPQINDLAYVYNSEGTAWLPGTLGGTYYPAGIYLYDGAVWVSDRNAIANQIDNVIHTDIAGEIDGITEKLTLHNDDWVLIEDSEDSNNKKKAKKSSLGGGNDFIEIKITGGVVSGSATSGFLAATNDMVEYQIEGSGGGASKIVYYSVIVPTNYNGNGAIKLDSWTTDFSGLTTWTISAYINGTIDSTVSAIEVTPTADTTYETTTNIIADTISAGDVLMIKLNFTGSNGDDIRLRRLTIE